MKITTYAIVIAVLVAAALLLRLYAPKDHEITYLASSGVQRGIQVNIAAFWLLILLTAVVSRLWGPKNWAITIPVSGDNTFYAILLKDAIFWLLIVVSIAATVAYVLKRV